MSSHVSLQAPFLDRPEPDVSVVIVAYNIPRELPRTLLSLSANYQRHIAPEDYEIIVVDNGSDPPVTPQLLEGLPGNFRLIRIDHATSSPAQAINRGLAAAQGRVIGVMVDGARIATPGLVYFALQGCHLYERAVVATLGWYLGSDSSQRWAIANGYDHAGEDALLASIDWPSDGYRLFEVGALDESSIDGWFAPIAESNALFLHRQIWQDLGGADERFELPGGGLLNLDMFKRALELPRAELVILLGEGTFHQFHGGIATNANIDTFPKTIGRWFTQYSAIRQQPWSYPLPVKRTYLGILPRPALTRFVRAAVWPFLPVAGNAEPPLGHEFDRDLWSMTQRTLPGDATVSELVRLAQAEFCAGRFAAAAAVARLARRLAPAEPEPQRLLSYASAWFRDPTPAPSESAQVHVALGEAYRLLGETKNANDHYRKALTFFGNLAPAHHGLASLRMAGDDYYVWLNRLQTALTPEVYVEIGVADGLSLALARPPTEAIGVDPAPTVISTLRANTHIFAETSDEFFAKRRLDGFLQGKPIKLAFVDGLHSFEQALRAFMNLEKHCGPGSAILLHDTVPLDEITQRRERQTHFWTGDVWKILPCLKAYRPDLEIFTIETAPTGLTVIVGLDPSSGVLADAYDEAVARFIDMPFADIEDRLYAMANVVANDWDLVSDRLKAYGVLIRSLPALRSPTHAERGRPRAIE
jgi:tetratricopeptide (TPR) repeat protein